MTDQPGAAPNLTAELGYGPDGTFPNTWSNWTTGTFNVDAGNNDEYQATLTVATQGTYRYAWRYSRNGGPFYYGDLDGVQNGVQLDQLGTLTVTAPSLSLQRVIDHIVGRITLTPDEFQQADVNDDDVIDVSDVILLLSQ